MQTAAFGAQIQVIMVVVEGGVGTAVAVLLKHKDSNQSGELAWQYLQKKSLWFLSSRLAAVMLGRGCGTWWCLYKQLQLLVLLLVLLLVDGGFGPGLPRVLMAYAAFPKLGCLFLGDSRQYDYSILGSTLECPCLGKLP